jgi:hypothetical protein
MTDGYYHGYLSAESGLKVQDLYARASVGIFDRVVVGRPAYRTEFGDNIRPLLVLLPGGRFLAGATLGEGMATSVCLNVLPDTVSGLCGYGEKRGDAMREAWYRAGEEARLYAEQFAAMYEADAIKQSEVRHDFC